MLINNELLNTVVKLREEKMAKMKTKKREGKNTDQYNGMAK